MLGRFQGMPGHDEIDGAVGAQHDQPRRLASPGNHGEHVHGRGIDPVQVLEEQHHRLDEREGLQALGELAQHPLPRNALESALERVEVSRRHQGRHPREPARRVAPQALHNARAAGRPAQPAEGLEQRQKRLPGAVVLHALPPGDCEGRRAGAAGQERLDESGLADAGLAGDEHHAPRAVERAGQQLVKPRKLGLSSHQDRDGGQHVRRARGPGRQRPGREVQSMRRGGHRGDEPIADPVHRLDIARLACVVGESLAQRLDLEGQGVLAHHCVAPDSIEERRLGDHLAGLAGEGPQDGQRLGRQLHVRPVREERSMRPDQSMGTEVERTRSRLHPTNGSDERTAPTNGSELLQATLGRRAPPRLSIPHHRMARQEGGPVPRSSKEKGGEDGRAGAEGVVIVEALFGDGPSANARNFLRVSSGLPVPGRLPMAHPGTSRQGAGPGVPGASRHEGR